MDQIIYHVDALIKKIRSIHDVYFYKLGKSHRANIKYQFNKYKKEIQQKYDGVSIIECIKKNENNLDVINDIVSYIEKFDKLMEVNVVL